MDEVLILVCQNEKGMYFLASTGSYQIDIHFSTINILDHLLNNQNPQNYAVRKVISRDHIEKYMQGTSIMH